MAVGLHKLSWQTFFRVSTDPNSRRQFVQMFSSDSPNDANVNDLSYSCRIESVLAQIRCRCHV